MITCVNKFNICFLASSVAGGNIGRFGQIIEAVALEDTVRGSSCGAEVCEVHLPHHFFKADAVHVFFNGLLRIQLVTGKVK